MTSTTKSPQLLPIRSFQHKEGLLVFSNYEDCLKLKPNSKLAIFDLDDTLVVTIILGHFAKEKNDCKLKFNEIPERLQDLFEKGFTIIIITNQLGISKEHVTVDDFTLKMNGLSDKLKIPFIVLVSIKNDEFRKPAVGSFLFLTKEIQKNAPKNKRENINDLNSQNRYFNSENKHSPKSNIYYDYDYLKFSDDQFTTITETVSEKTSTTRFKSISFTPGKNCYVSFENHYEFALKAQIDSQSFFCGDAAGRNQNGSSDFSNTDLLFAINCKLNFYLPEQVFQNRMIDSPQFLPQFELLDRQNSTNPSYSYLINTEKWRTIEKSNIFVMLVGPSSSGKTYLCNKVFKDFKVVGYVN